MQVEQHPYLSRRKRGTSVTVAGGGDSSGVATVSEHEVRVGEGNDERAGEDEEGEEEGEGGGEDGDEDGEGQEEEDYEDEHEDEGGEDGDNDDQRASPSQQEEDEDAWEDVAYESLARNLGRRRRRYLHSRSSQVLRGNLQKLSGLI